MNTSPFCECPGFPTSRDWIQSLFLIVMSLRQRCGDAIRSSTNAFSVNSRMKTLVLDKSRQTAECIEGKFIIPQKHLSIASPRTEISSVLPLSFILFAFCEPLWQSSLLNRIVKKKARLDFLNVRSAVHKSVYAMIDYFCSWFWCISPAYHYISFISRLPPPRFPKYNKILTSFTIR